MATLERWRPQSWLRAWRPERELSRWEEEVEDLFDNFFRRAPMPLLRGRRPLLETRGWAPPVDMYEQDNELVVRLDIPGVDKKDIHVGMTDDTLTIEGERKAESEIKDDDYYCSERRYGRFYRAITLPTEVESDKIKAEYHDGLLEVHLPKTKEAKAKKVEVAVQ